MKKKSIGKSRLWVAFVAFALFFGASAVPVKTAVFTGFGPRGEHPSGARINMVYFRRELKTMKEVHSERRPLQWR